MLFLEAPLVDRDDGMQTATVRLPWGHPEASEELSRAFALLDEVYGENAGTWEVTVTVNAILSSIKQPR